MRIGQTSAIVFFSKILTSVFGFVATIYLARVLGAGVFGYYASIIAVAMWLQLFGQIGVANSVTKRVSEGKEQSAYFTAGLIFVLTLGGFASMGTWLFRDLVRSYIGVEAALFVIAIVMANLFRSIVISTLEGERLVHISALLKAGQVGLRSTVQISLVVIGFGLGAMVLGFATGAFLAGLAGLFFLSSSITRPRLSHFKHLFEFAKFAWLGNLRGKMFNNVDILILSAMVNPALVGIYSVSWMIARFLKTFGAAIRETVFPEISSANEADDDSLISQLLTDGFSYGGLLTIPGFFGAVIVGDRLLRLYGDEFVEGTVVLVVLISVVLVDEYHRQMLNTLNGVDRPELAFRINAVFLSMNVVLNVVFVYYFGWVGAAVATLISVSTGTLLAYYVLSDIVSFTVPIGEVSRQFVAALVMSAIILGTEWFLADQLGISHNAFLLFVLVGLGAGTYFLVLLGISGRFRGIIMDNLPSRFLEYWEVENP